MTIILNQFFINQNTLTYYSKIIEKKKPVTKYTNFHFSSQRKSRNPDIQPNFPAIPFASPSSPPSSRRQPTFLARATNRQLVRISLRVYVVVASRGFSLSLSPPLNGARLARGKNEDDDDEVAAAAADDDEEAEVRGGEVEEEEDGGRGSLCAGAHCRRADVTVI